MSDALGRPSTDFADEIRKLPLTRKESPPDRDRGMQTKTLYPSMRGMLRYGDFPFPVVLFCFTMENNEGWYTWVAEPVVSPSGDFGIVPHGDASCRPLNTDAIDEIVEAVDRWYDAFFAKAIRERPSKKRSGSSAK